MFSVGGKVYSSEPLTYTYMEDRIFETSRNVSIKLHRRVGRFVKIRLSFAAKWIMISEITFDSGECNYQVFFYSSHTPMTTVNFLTAKTIKPCFTFSETFIIFNNAPISSIAKYYPARLRLDVVCVIFKLFGERLHKIIIHIRRCTRCKNYSSYI